MEHHQTIHRITDHQNWTSSLYQSEHCRLDTGEKKKKKKKKKVKVCKSQKPHLGIRTADENNQILHISQFCFLNQFVSVTVKSKVLWHHMQIEVKPEKTLMFHEALRYQLKNIR